MHSSSLVDYVTARDIATQGYCFYRIIVHFVVSTLDIDRSGSGLDMFLNDSCILVHMRHILHVLANQQS